MPDRESNCDAGEYTADKLRELRKQAISYPVPRAPTEDAQRPVAAPAFKLSGSFKPATAAADDRFQAPVSLLLQLCMAQPLAYP